MPPASQIAILLACVTLMACMHANTGEYPLHPEGLIAPAKAPEEVIYRPRSLDDRGFNRVIQAISVPTLTVYHPDQPRADRAALVICPGGGYQYVVIDREGHALARHFQQRGFTVVVLKYRLPQPPHADGELPASQQDALEAIRFVRRHAPSWKVNSSRIGILGASAGGHLAGSTAIFGTVDDLSRPDFVVLLYPVVTLDGEPTHGGSRRNLLGEEPSAAQVAAFSLQLQVRADLPPFFLAHAKNDRPVPPENSRMLAAALQKVNVPVELFEPATGGHGFALGRSRESSEWPDRFIRWLDALPATP